jgi:lipid A 3-O-deacylase
MKSKVLALGAMLLAALASRGGEETNTNSFFESAGIHYGHGADHDSRDFQEFEAQADVNLPFKLDLGRNWELKSRVGFSLGSFGNSHVTSVIGSIGPIFSVGPSTWPVALEAEFAPTGLSEHEFDTRSVGSLLQFRSSIGLAWMIEKRVRVGYRFQHMSNGGLASHNQGVNMHTLSVAYCF